MEYSISAILCITNWTLFLFGSFCSASSSFKVWSQGGSPGVVVMGGDSCYEGHGFESRQHILDEHFFTYVCCKKRNDVWLKRQKINDKIGLGWPIYKKNEQKIWSNTKCINLVMLSFFKMGQSRPFIYFRPFLISIAVDTTELWPFSCDSLFRKIVLFSFQFQ